MIWLTNWRRLALQAMLISFGEIPHPGASNQQLEKSVKNALVKASEGYEIDPEVPDSLLAILLPALKIRGLDRQSIVQFITGMNALPVGGGGGGGGTGGYSGAPSLPGSAPADPGVVGMTVDEGEPRTGFASGDETVVENILDIGKNVLTGNIGGVVSSIGDTVLDLVWGGHLI